MDQEFTSTSSEIKLTVTRAVFSVVCSMGKENSVWMRDKTYLRVVF